MGLEIAQFFENKTVLVTGATGFLGKVFVERMLRVQPNVKKLFVLVRAADSSSAAKRVQEEIVETRLFRVLRESQGLNADSSLQRIVAIAGDVSCEDLGISDSQLKREMWEEIDIIVNSAATTNFDERYDVALGINTFGAANLMSFAHKCANLRMFLHVSTAYTCGDREGRVLEKPFRMGETLNGLHNLDINAEQKMAMELLGELRRKDASEDEISKALKDLGIHRARVHGWPNTYAFTKAMGEMLLGHSKKGHLPLLIFRPTIVTSTFEQPFPGWMESFRTVDSIAFAYGKGKLKFFLADPRTILDVIPVDMVVNAMIVGAAVNGHRSRPSLCRDSDDLVVHSIGSSSRNPITLVSLRGIIRRYFEKNPLINEDGRPVKVGKVRLMSSMSIFRIYVTLRYLIPIKVLRVASSAPCLQNYKGLSLNLHRKVKVALKLSELYKPYVFFKGIFDDSNTKELREEARKSGVDLDVFNFDPRSIISWEDYFMDTHFPGALLAINPKK